MIQIRRSGDRGHFDHGWLQSYHTFSFAAYRDPNHMGFRVLRVMNEDFIQPGQGFGTHPHRDMEIITYVLEGALEHRDSLGNGEILWAGEFQRMSAGRGIEHSELNPSQEQPVHLYQIWLYPARKGIEPSYEQKRFPNAELTNQLKLVASPQEDGDALRIHQDARVYLGRLEGGQTVQHRLEPGRYGWLQVLGGVVELNRENLQQGDGAAISEESELVLRTESGGQVMLFDLP